MRNIPRVGETSEIFSISAGRERQLTFTLDNRSADEVLVGGIPTLFFSKAFSKENQQIFYLVQTEPARGAERFSRRLRPAEYPLLATNNGFAEPEVVGARGLGAALAMNQILVQSDRGGEGMFNIWRIGTDGRSAVRLTVVGAAHPDWWIPLPGVTDPVEIDENGSSPR